MNVVKKSINISSDLANLLDEFIQGNPGANFTMIANQALRDWVKKEKHIIQIQKPKPLNTDLVDKMITEDNELMKDLAK